MKAQMKWIEGMTFESMSDGNQIKMDAKSPIGQGTAMTPKELVVNGLGGCTAMDVVALFKKHKQNVKDFVVEVDVETSKGLHPAVFTAATIIYKANGDISADIFKEAVHLSQTKYCGVSAMLSKAFPIKYQVILNNQQIAEGQAHF